MQIHLLNQFPIKLTAQAVVTRGHNIRSLSVLIILIVTIQKQNSVFNLINVWHDFNI
jgi:hypothetical protein